MFGDFFCANFLYFPTFLKSINILGEKMSFTLGCHLSAVNGFLAMGKTAEEIGANTFAFFTRNPQGGKAKDIDENDALALVDFLKSHNFGTLVAHAPYTMNLCSDKENIREFANEMLADNLKRMEYIPNQYYIICTPEAI